MSEASPVPTEGDRQPADFDPARLETVLRGVLPGATGPMQLVAISGGQSNPTFFLHLGSHRYVLRKRPPGVLLPSAHAIDREYRVMQALAGTGVPVPRMILYHDDPTVIGTPFYLMERLDGRVFHDCALPGLLPDERRAIYLSIAETLARLHSIVPSDVGLADFGRPGNYFARQTERWSKQWRGSPSAGSIPALDELATWLAHHLPPDDGESGIAHGDFRVGNMMFHPTEPRVVGVLDWELSTLGHPLADLGFCCLAWHLRPDEFHGIAGLDRESLGIPSQTEFVAHYLEHMRPGPGSLLPFHLAFALFRFAVIFVGIANRARAGNAAAENAAEIGHLAQNFSERALEIIAAG
jgi:aminoglycoside phosphotransferase (APT) family kinase protein